MYGVTITILVTNGYGQKGTEVTTSRPNKINCQLGQPLPFAKFPGTPQANAAVWILDTCPDFTQSPEQAGGHSGALTPSFRWGSLGGALRRGNCHCIECGNGVTRTRDALYRGIKL